ncbi:hypothetical protein U1Q18_030571 [Sarracenia purpurea var. burkii]
MEGYNKKLVGVMAFLLVGMMSSISSNNNGVVRMSNAQSLCGVTLWEALSCQSAVRVKNPTPPSDRCCAAAKKANFTCLCPYKNSPELPANGVNPDRVLQLPVLCDLGPAVNC